VGAFRHRVRAATVDLVLLEGNLVPAPGIHPTPERMAKGDVVGRRSLTPGVLEQLAAAGDLGENIPELVIAAEWFMEQAELSGVRGRLVVSQLMTKLPSSAPAGKTLARQHLLRSYDWLGHDGWNILYDALVWNSDLRGPERRAMFRMALHALSQALSAKKPR
jgi:hypothetical protein